MHPQVKDLFKGEKTALFWAGLVSFGVSLYFLCNAIWQVIYYYFVVPQVTHQIITSAFSSSLFMTILGVAVPSLFGGTIFMVIGLMMMKAGIKRNQSPNPNQS